MNNKRFIPVYEPSLLGREKEYVNQCLDSTWISSKGEFIGRFERAFAEYIGAEYATSVCNGTVALHLALEALGITTGDEVIVPTFTYIASVNAIIQTGATPIFVDSIESTWQMNPCEVRRKITPKTKAVMAVHLYGLPCEMDLLVEICKENKIYLVEDCAEAFGSLYKKRHVGLFGDIAIFSFFGNKTITTGEGGMVVARDHGVFERALALKNQSVSKIREYWHDGIGYNYRMTNICAAIGLAQIERADSILSKKREIAHWYRDGLAGLPVEMHKERVDLKHSFWMISILLNSATTAQKLREYLKSNDVETRRLFYPASLMDQCHSDQSFPIAESLGSRGLNLPSYPNLSREDVDYICYLISEFFRNNYD